MIFVTLREINKCSDEQKKIIRDIRNLKSIRKSMFTDHEISLDEHMSWLEKLKIDKRQIVFVVLVDNVVSGIVSVNTIDMLNLKSDWAFYLVENVRGGLGAVLEFNLINFVFDVLRLEKLNCEVIEKNDAVVKMHKKFSFNEEGFRRENIIKNQKRIGIYLLGLTKSDWLRDREKIKSKYSKIMEKFDLVIEYEPN